jgi:hypothetical protein
MLALTDLSPAARLYLLGRLKNDVRAAEAVAAVLFLNEPIRAVAMESGLSRATLHRTVRHIRAGIAELMEQKIVVEADLVVSE